MLKMRNIPNPKPNPSKMLRTRTAVALCVLMFSQHSTATEFTWNAVVTQGAFYTNHNNVYGQSEQDPSFDFTELSVNGAYAVMNDLRLSGQVMYRHAGAGFDDVNLDYLFLDKQLWYHASFVGGVRVGRIKNSIGLYNDARDVAFTRPSIYLPQSVYRDLTSRGSLLAADGAYFYSDSMFESGSISVEMGLGKNIEDNLSNFENIEQLSGFDVGFESEKFYFYRVSYAPLTFDTRIIFSGFKSSVLVDSVIDGGVINPGVSLPVSRIPFSMQANSHVNLLSLEHVREQLTVTVEYGQVDILFDSPQIDASPQVQSVLNGLAIDAFPNIDAISETFYFQVQRRLSAQQTIFARADFYYLDKSDRSGQDFEDAGRGQRHSRFARDYGVGIQWTPKQEMLIMLECHYIDGVAWLNSVENPSFQRDSKRYWHLIAATFSYRF